MDANWPLTIAAALNLAVAALHFACVFWGAEGFRLLGAGEPLVTWARQGHWYPPVIAAVLAGVFTLWAAYAASGAGLIQPLPGLRGVLGGITLIYLARALGFPLIMRFFPDNTKSFWWISSGTCLFIGLVHGLGLIQLWPHVE